MFNFIRTYKLKKRRKEENHFIHLAEENGIILPQSSIKIRERRPGDIRGMNYWTTSNKRRAKIAKRELEKRGLI